MLLHGPHPTSRPILQRHRHRRYPFSRPSPLPQLTRTPSLAPRRRRHPRPRHPGRLRALRRRERHRHRPLLIPTHPARPRPADPTRDAHRPPPRRHPRKRPYQKPTHPPTNPPSQLLRTGTDAALKALSPSAQQALAARPEPNFVGLEATRATLRWLWAAGFAAAASDAPSFERGPVMGAHHDPAHVLHQWLLAGWGMPIGELFDLEGVAAECKRQGRWAFWFGSVVLNVSFLLFFFSFLGLCVCVC